MFLYFRMMLIMGVALFTSRIVLRNLGIEDFGIYNVVGGIVTMFTFLNGSLGSATSRYITFELGRKNYERLNQVFNVAFLIHVAIGIIVIVLAETVGLWFFYEKMSIPADRIDAAQWVYQISILTCFFSLTQVPYSAAIIAHENMRVYAWIGIVEVLAKLVIVYLLVVSPFDKLVFYGILVLAVSVSIQLMYWIYCKKNFPECQYSTHIDKVLFKDMFGFAGWNFLTTCTSMLSSQGVGIMLNMHFGTAINAARGVASQINGTVGAFSRNFTTALNPQITKSYAAGDIAYTTKLVCRGAKFSYLLFLFIALPCMFEVDFFLSKWLTEMPPYAGIFVQLTFLNTLVEILLNSNETLNRASGKIRKFQIIISVAQLLILIVSYIVLEITGNSILTVAVTNVIYLLIFIPRITVNKPYIGITFGYFFKHTLRGVMIVTCISTLVCFAFLSGMEQGWIRLFGTSIVSTLTIAITSWFFALTKGEREKTSSFIRKKIYAIKQN